MLLQIQHPLSFQQEPVVLKTYGAWSVEAIINGNNQLFLNAYYVPDIIAFPSLMRTFVLPFWILMLLMPDKMVIEVQLAIFRIDLFYFFFLECDHLSISA